MEKVKNFIRLMRPRQWFKSFYIALGSAPAILLMPVRLDLIILFLFAGILNMILLQGVMYITNDIADAEKDRAHPKKKNRPIASGKVPAKEAFAFGLFLLFSALTLAFFLDFRIFLIDVALFINNVLYSFGPIRLKDRVYLDVASAALNFPLRVMVGWYLFEPYNQARFSFSYNFTSTSSITNSIQSILFNSHPRIIDLSVRFSTITLSFASIMAMTYFTAVFLLDLKRLAEKLNLKNAERVRKTLKGYTVTNLILIAVFSALMAFGSFLLLSWSLKPVLVILSPFILSIMYWYYRFTFEKNSIVSTPEEIFGKKPKFVLTIIALCVFALILLLL